MTINLRDALENAEGAWEETEAMESTSSERLPEGDDYVFEINIPKSGNTVQVDSDGKVRARVVLRVLHPEDLKGRTHTPSWEILHPNDEGELEPTTGGMRAIKTIMERLGYDPSDYGMADVASFFLNLEGAHVQGTIRYGGDEGQFTNCYLNSMIEAPPAEA